MDIYQYAYGNAANDQGCKAGPFTLERAAQKKAVLHSHCQWHAPLQLQNQHYQAAATPDVARLATQLANDTANSVAHQRFFTTLGGDHTMAIGSWSGASVALNHALGLIWFDAHMDSHTTKTSETQNIHGMPLAALLGYGDATLTQILSPQPKIKPKNLVLIGTHSFEPDEEALLKKLRVKIFYMDDIKKLGLKNVFLQAIEIVTQYTNGFGISIDLDGFDPIDAPGVCVPVNGGIRSEDFFKHFSLIAHHEKLVGADIAEFNPARDHEHKTEKVAIDILQEFATR